MKFQGDNAGQAMLESFLAILLISLMFFGLIQLALVSNAKQILHHSAARAARARSVGFNDWMIRKTALVAAIPNSGAMIEPVLPPPANILDPNKSFGENWDEAIDTTQPIRRSDSTIVELARIPEFLASENSARAEQILNYEEWTKDAISVSMKSGTGLELDTIRTQVRQRYPLLMPFHTLIYNPANDSDGIDRITLDGNSAVIDYSSLYLD